MSSNGLIIYLYVYSTYLLPVPFLKDFSCIEQQWSHNLPVCLQYLPFACAFLEGFLLYLSSNGLIIYLYVYSTYLLPVPFLKDSCICAAMVS